jgi:Uma2 family endonuclease
MATVPSAVSLEEYMRTDYSPDCEYVDGTVLERNVGQGKHAYSQGEIYVLLREQAKRIGFLALPEQRVKVSPWRVRVPDACVVEKLEEVITDPPVLCVEVFSPDDRWSRINQRVADYIAMGVPCVWIVDPYERRTWVIDEDRPPAEVTDGILRSRHFEIALSEVLPPQED